MPGLRFELGCSFLPYSQINEFAAMRRYEVVVSWQSTQILGLHEDKAASCSLTHTSAVERAPAYDIITFVHRMATLLALLLNALPF